MFCVRSLMPQTTRNAAAAFLKIGIAVVPIESRKKSPNIKGWQNWPKKKFTINDFSDSGNIGILCGKPSKWLIDLDLDTPAAIALAPLNLPTTGLTFGRKSAPRSHWLYYSEDCDKAQFTDVKTTEILLEIRSTKQQTVVPPSVHPSGELVDWVTKDKPATVDKDTLYKGAALLAIAVQIALLWPNEKGSRHDLALATGGYLARRFPKIEPKQIGEIVNKCGEIGHDDEHEDRGLAARGSAEKYRANEPVTGAPKLADLLGNDVVKALDRWCGGNNQQVDIYTDPVILESMERFNKNYAAITAGGMARIACDDHCGRGPELLTVDAFKLKHKPEKVLVEGRKMPVYLSDAWLEWPERRFYAGRELAPPPRICHPEVQNLWRGWAVDPGEANIIDPEAWIEHVHEVICNGEDAHTKWVLDWCAQMTQEPGTPPGASIVMRSKEGTGKGATVQPLLSLFYPQNRLQISQLDQLVGRFSGHLSSVVLLFSDEATWGGNRAGAGRMKALITESNISIEEKGLRTEQMNNCLHIIIASNEDWVVQIGARSRRFFILDVSDKYASDENYFNKLHKRIGSDPSGPLGIYNPAFLRGLLRYLLDRQYNRVSLRNPPKTQALLDQHTRSLKDVEKWWLDKLSEGEILENQGWDVAKSSDLHNDFITSDRSYSTMSQRCLPSR